MGFKFLAACAAGLLAAVVSQPSEARLVKLTIQSRAPYLHGVTWGSAGSYELLTGAAQMEVDPTSPSDSIITDLAGAPKTAKGLVKFSTQFLILKPTDMSLSNDKIFYAVNNRGNSLEGLLTATSLFRRPASSSRPCRAPPNRTAVRSPARCTTNTGTLPPARTRSTSKDRPASCRTR
jgi:hypothetical protein